MEFFPRWGKLWGKPGGRFSDSPRILRRRATDDPSALSCDPTRDEEVRRFRGELNSCHIAADRTAVAAPRISIHGICPAVIERTVRITFPRVIAPSASSVAVRFHPSAGPRSTAAAARAHTAAGGSTTAVANTRAPDVLTVSVPGSWGPIPPAKTIEITYNPRIASASPASTTTARTRTTADMRSNDPCVMCFPRARSPARRHPLVRQGHPTSRVVFWWSRHRRRPLPLCPDCAPRPRLTR